MLQCYHIAVVVVLDDVDGRHHARGVGRFRYRLLLLTSCRHASTLFLKMLHLTLTASLDLLLVIQGVLMCRYHRLGLKAWVVMAGCRRCHRVLYLKVLKVLYTLVNVWLLHLLQVIILFGEKLVRCSGIIIVLSGQVAPSVTASVPHRIVQILHRLSVV